MDEIINVAALVLIVQSIVVQGNGASAISGLPVDYFQ